MAENRKKIEKVQQVLDADEEAPWTILGVNRNAGKDEVNRARKKICLLVHPDKFQDEQEKLRANQAFQKVQDACEKMDKGAEERQREERARQAEEREREVARKAQEERELAERERARRQAEEDKRRAEEVEARRQEEEKKAEAERRENEIRMEAQRRAEEQRAQERLREFMKAERERAERENREARRREDQAEAQKREEEAFREAQRNMNMNNRRSGGNSPGSSQYNDDFEDFDGDGLDGSDDTEADSEDSEASVDQEELKRAIEESKRLAEEEKAAHLRAEKARKDAEAEAEAEAKAEAERVRREAETERMRQEAEQRKREADLERKRKEAETMQREKEAERLKKEAERMKREEEAERIRKEAETRRKEAERQRTEEERLRKEAEARREAARRETEERERARRAQEDEIRPEAEQRAADEQSAEWARRQRPRADKAGAAEQSAAGGWAEGWGEREQTGRRTGPAAASRDDVEEDERRQRDEEPWRQGAAQDDPLRHQPAREDSVPQSRGTDQPQSGLEREMGQQPRTAAAQGTGAASSGKEREQAKSEVLSRRLVKRMDKIDRVFFTFSFGRTTALINAVERDDIEALHLLIKAGANVDKQLSGCWATGSTAMTKAAERNMDTHVQILLDSQADPNIARRDGKNALLLASHLGHRETALCLVHGEANVNLRDFANVSPILLWVHRGDVEMTQVLLSKGAKPSDTYPGTGATAIIHAVQHGSCELVQCLCDHTLGRDAAINLKDGQGYTALLRAIELPISALRQQKAEILVNTAKADLNDARIRHPKTGRTPIICAAEIRDSWVVTLLVQGNANVNLEDTKGETALKVATEKQDHQVQDILLEAGADPNKRDPKDGSTVLFTAARQGDVQSARMFLRKGAKVNLKDDSGCTALMVAIPVVQMRMRGRPKGSKDSIPGQVPGNFGMAKLLVEEKADVNIQYPDDGSTVLSRACERSDVESVKLFLDNHAKVDVKDNSGCTALMVAEKYDICKLLVERNADVNIQYNDRTTVLFRAARKGDVPSVKLYLDHRAKVDVKDNSGCTALMVAEKYDICKLLVKRNADVNIQYNDRTTVLFRAARKGDVPSVKLYLDHRAKVDVKDNSGCTALMVAEKYDICKLLVERNADVNIQYPEDKSTVLFRAAKSGEVRLAQLYLDHGATVDLKDKRGYTALMVAQSYAISKLLVERNANVNFRFPDKSTVLILAASNEDEPLVALFLSGRAEVDVQDEKGWTALMYATKKLNAAIVKKLVDAGGSVDGVDRHSGTTPLMLAVQKGNSAIVSVLLAGKGRDATLDRQDAVKRRTALIYAASAGYVELTTALLRANAATEIADCDGETALLAATHRRSRKQDVHSLNTMRALLQANAVIDARDKSGSSVLLMVVADGDIPALTMILETASRVNLNIKDRGGRTPLIVAAQHGHLKVTETLLERDADKDSADDEGNTALIHAVRGGELALVKVLARAGADVNFRKRGGAHSLLLAVDKQRADIVSTLIGHRANVEERHSDGSTPLIMAVKQDNIEIARHLLNAKANPSSRQNGATALMIAIQAKRYHTIDFVNALATCGASLEDKFERDNGSTPLIYAVKNEMAELVDTLLRYEAQVNATDDSRMTALAWAVKKSKEHLVELLLESGADCNIADNRNDTPLMTAARKGHVQIAQRLKFHRADIKIRNHRNKTALEIAIDNFGLESEIAQVIDPFAVKQKRDELQRLEEEKRRRALELERERNFRQQQQNLALEKHRLELEHARIKDEILGLEDELPPRRMAPPRGRGHRVRPY